MPIEVYCLILGVGDVFVPKGVCVYVFNLINLGRLFLSSSQMGFFYYTAQAGFELIILLSQLFKCLDYDLSLWLIPTNLSRVTLQGTAELDQ